MKLNYAIICYKQIDEDHIEVKHKCCYEQEPRESDIESLKEELATDEDFEMIGDTDYEVRVINRWDDYELMDLFEIPIELNDDEEEI